MISEDHQQLGHPLPAYALLALNTMRLMHTAEIAAILKGGQGWVKVDVEAGSESKDFCAIVQHVPFSSRVKPTSHFEKAQ